MIVEARGLCVRRQGREILRAIDLSIACGELVALTGPNGAGKTSLLRAIAGFLKPAEGTIDFRDRAPSGAQQPADLKVRGPEEAAHLLHFLGHRDGLKSALGVREHAVFWRELLEGGGDVAATLERVGLARIADLPARVLSAGQARRLALTRLLVAPRPLWLLDEPAAALDTQGKALIAEMISTHCAGGGIVVAAVHEPLGNPTQTIQIERAT